MPQSKVSKDPKHTLNETGWIVSLLATGDKYGGHAKIIVEGLRNDSDWLTDAKNNPTGSNFFIAEYHIIPDTNPSIQSNIIPPALINTKCKFAIYFSERSEYKNDKIKQYAESTSKSWRVNKERAMRMINTIKKEQADYDLEHNYQAYQYDGKYRIFASNNGHNCVTWCEEKLVIAEIKMGKLPFDWLKAAPVKHANSLTQIIDNAKEDIDNTDFGNTHTVKQSNSRYSYWCCKSTVVVPILTVAAVATAIIAKSLQP